MLKKISNEAGYDLWSKSYDSYANPTVAMDEMHFPKLWADLNGKDVLEIGAGTGRHTLKLLRQGNRVTAVDLSAGMLDEARRKAAQVELPPGARLEILHGDVLKASLPTTAFEAALTALVIEHIADLGPFFRRVADLLKPGGLFYVSEIHPSKYAAGGDLAHFRTEEGEDFYLNSHAHSEEAILRAAAEAGFKLRLKEDAVAGDELTAQNPKWAKHQGRAMVLMLILQKS